LLNIILYTCTCRHFVSKIVHNMCYTADCVDLWFTSTKFNYNGLPEIFHFQNTLQTNDHY